MGFIPTKECPYCGIDSFGWWDLLRLGYSVPRECASCGKLVRNSRSHQVLCILSPILLLVLAFLLLPAAPDWLVIPALIFLLPLSVVLFVKPTKLPADQAPIDLSPFTPNPENDKAILIQGWNEDELRKILDDFVEQDLSAFAAFQIEIERQSESSFVLSFPEDIHPDEFICLINYLAYPFELDFAGRSIIVAGETTLNSDFDGLPHALTGTKALLYLPENDDDYEVIYMQIESGAVFVKSLSEGDWRKVTDARMPLALRSISPVNFV